MAGLYTGSNLSEQGLNAIDALGNLYEPGIHNDINLFSNASKLVSKLTTSGVENQFNRTKFLTIGASFSDNTSVWIESGPGLVRSVNGSVVNLKVLSTGLGYSVKTSTGQAVTLPATVQARLYGIESGAKNCVVELSVEADGSIDQEVSIIAAGSGYILGEQLSILPPCGQGDVPQQDRCYNYSGNRIDKEGYKNNARFGNTVYSYTVRVPDEDGFFLYDPNLESEVYLGTSLPTGSFVFVRDDKLNRENLSSLYKINGESQTYSYGVSFSVSEVGLKSTIDSLDNNLTSINTSLVDFIQNCRLSSTGENDLDLSYNTTTGKNIFSQYRMVLRDPDGVLDDPAISYSSIQSDTTSPGIWVKSGASYQRIFTSDDRPFIDQYLSPVFYKISSGSFVPVQESGDYKYSVSSAYYKPGQPVNTSSVIGFNTEIKTLVQNLSLSNNDGGFVYHRTLTPTTIRDNLKSWPLASFKENSVTKEARFLAI